MNNQIEREPTINEMRLYLRLLDVLGIMIIFVCLVFWKLDFNDIFLGFFLTMSGAVLFELLVRSHITRRLISEQKQKDNRLRRLFEEQQKKHNENEDQ